MGSTRAVGALKHYAVVLAAKTVVGISAWLGGFRAISDDDFARVVLAQRWALEPALDPTGTSWLPLPFWVYGVALKIFGSSLTVARALAFALGLASAALMLASARRLVGDRRAALWGALMAACFPYSAWLGVATVPELPTAALTLFAIASLQSESGEDRRWGALALFAACLCRYEPWMVAPWFAFACLSDARRATLGKRAAWTAALIATTAPLLWLLHNRIIHGDALHFLARVSAYQRALGGHGRVVGRYALDLVRKEPELWSVGLAAIAAMPATCYAALASRRRTLLIAAALFGSLLLSGLFGGSATHHPERSLLVLWLLLAVASGAAMRKALASSTRRRFAALVLLAVPLAALVLRPWYARLDAFTTRSAEVTLGRALGRALGPRPGTERVLVEVVDYGFFALQAASGRPQHFVLDRSIDPRQPPVRSSFTSLETLTQRCRVVAAESVVGRIDDQLVPADAVRERAARLGWWGCL